MAMPALVVAAVVLGSGAVGKADLGQGWAVAGTGVVGVGHREVEEGVKQGQRRGVEQWKGPGIDKIKN